MTLVRFAPSPTGRLHLGNAFIALVNFLFARKSGGRFLLRLDDTDRERSTSEFAAAIKSDLAWFGIGWDEFARQSDRLERYDAAIERLKKSGRLYACYETPEELALKRKAQLTAGKPPVYDRAALALSDAEKSALEAQGIAPHWRFKLQGDDPAWTDLVQGDSHIQIASMSDPVLIRADGVPLYTLASVVDDGEMGVTHIIRGADHISNTGVQLQLFAALGFPPPGFAHLPLISDAEGQGLSKRIGSLSLESLRDSGLEPLAIASLLLRLGQGEPPEICADWQALVEAFDIAKFGHATPRLSEDDLTAMNARLLHTLPYEAVADRLPEGADAALWEAVKGNIQRLSEIPDWQRIVAGQPDSQPTADMELLDAAAGLLPPEPWDKTSWKAWTKAVQEATGRKGKALFLPLRLALTGREHGPELANLLPLIGRKRVLERLCRR
ncbi:MAG: glutamate--tRNA ligase [Oceanibaculum nanhaiense]|uniref:glutamate--tRNA ligase n=1 Tax=Oceanibaculum nanhaiense TaxID=1909734 RepID=UPI0025A412CC|nr:glutamate--tRNA ligase [Oceanibaculum nanhaiense]MDM7946759.1 glutamate--tRNA ligase [Oceanibaculum nanhaiense]